MSEIIVLPPAETALQVFTTPAGLDPYLEKIKQELDAFVPDVTTKKGRDAIASMAHKVARSKTALDNIGKELVAELKDVPKKIDAERKRMRDTLDAWKDDVRRPLTEWEEAEEARVNRHKAGLSWFELRATENSTLDAAELKAAIFEVERVDVGQAWEEFEAEAHRAKAKALESLKAALEKREAYEAEQAELARLRAEAAAREQKEREERIAREAEERAKREAEAQAQAERDAAAQREAQAKADAERRELELKLTAERAERERAEAEQRAVQAEKDAEARAQAAAQAERQRIADEEAKVKAEEKRREEDKAHKGKVNRAALKALVEGGLTEDAAKIAITLIAQGKVPSVRVIY